MRDASFHNVSAMEVASGANERPFLLLVVGYPAGDARVPDIGRKDLDEIATFL